MVWTGSGQWAVARGAWIPDPRAIADQIKMGVMVTRAAEGLDVWHTCWGEMDRDGLAGEAEG